MFLGNEGRVVQRVNWSIKIWLQMFQFGKYGATVNAVKQDVVVVRLVWKPSVVQEHILQTLAAFRFMCYTNRGILLHWGCVRAKADGFRGRAPAMQEGHVVSSAEEKAVSDKNGLSSHW
jgi:hypothetical protein